MAIYRLCLSNRRSIIKLLYGHDEYFIRLASERFNINFRPCTAIGLSHKDRIIGCVIYNNFHRDIRGFPMSIDASVLMLEKAPLTKYNLHALLSYPFSDLHVRRLEVRVARKNRIHRKLAERMGFVFEGIAREAYEAGGDAAIYSLLDTEWQNGKFGSLSARSGDNRKRPNFIQSANGTLSSWP